jgi:7-cyano-7-deazaguanine reductase
MNTMNPLGQSTAYVGQYDPSLLYPIARDTARQQLGIQGPLPFSGYDRWTAYEVSWLDEQGMPQVRWAEFSILCDSPYIIESKSFKLYLNSYNQTTFLSEAAVVKRIQQDLSIAAGADVQVDFFSLSDALTIEKLPGTCIDERSISVNSYHPSPELLKVNRKQQVDHEVLYSHLLKTNCPVTGQPDWATVFVDYSGAVIQIDSLLAYIISFRDHQDFHENCVERIFCDIQQRCQPDKLTVYARYTRRGGLDINPLRSNDADGQSKLLNASLRTSRQ